MHEGLSYFHADESFPFSCMERRTYFKRYKLLVYHVDQQQGTNVNFFKGFCDSGF